MADIESLHRIEREILPLLLKHGSVADIVSKEGKPEAEVLRAVRWLAEKKLVSLKEAAVEVVELDGNGKLYLSKGLPEKRFLEAVGKSCMGMQQLMKSADLSSEEVNISIGLLRRNGWVDVSKGACLEFSITAAGSKKLASGFDEEKLLKELVKGKVAAELSERQKKLVEELRKRKSIVKVSERKIITAALTAEGSKAAKNPKLGEKVIDSLTPEMIKSGSWKTQKFRPYNLTLPAPKVFFGKKQPYRRFLEEVRARLVALGFKEMSGPVVESEFWDMDALFMPQFHSARDIHDAYYIKNPRHATNLPKEIVAKVKAAHEKGIPGSRGWRYEFSEEKTSRLILRSHDTSISPRTLCSKDLQVPGKYFQIARCFRYDVIDATHNADFDQIGGFVVGDGLNLRHLFGILRLFAREFCNTDDVKVVPSYFPFTEPSVGLYAKHPVMGWIELAGAGIFRPEMTHPLGVDKPVIAWGIGLGRVAMFKLGLKDIRQLYSHDLDYLRSARVI